METEQKPTTIEIKHHQDWIEKQTWIFAKSWAKRAPHEYVARGKLDPENQQHFEELVMFIRKYGYPRKFGGRKYMYFDFDGKMYWTMGAPLNITIILNRANLEDQQ